MQISVARDFHLFSSTLVCVSSQHTFIEPSAMSGTNNLPRDKILLLFDVDGTLTKPRSQIESSFEEFLYNEIKPRATIGIVGGSDLEKMLEQMNGKRVLSEFDLMYPENGLLQLVKGIEVGRECLQKHLGEEKLQKFINFVLRYLSTVEIPVKRGTFIEFRSGMINVSPIGRQCSREERNAFEQYDKEHKVRAKMIEALKKEFPDIDLTYSIGGQISFDVFPHGWDKTFSLRHATKYSDFQEIHFFGDKTDPGGNDHEIFEDPRTIGHKVSSPEDTRRMLSELFHIK